MLPTVIPNSNILFSAQVNSHTSQREDENMGAFRTCCCCLSLRTGCIILAVIEILYPICQLAATYRNLPSFFIFGTVGCIISDVVLIFGAVRRHRSYLWAKIVYNIATILLLIVGLGFSIYAIFDIKERYNSEEEKKLLPGVYVLIAVQVLVIVILAISTLIVHSFVCELRNEERLSHQNNYRNTAPPHVYHSAPVRINQN